MAGMPDDPSVRWGWNGPFISEAGAPGPDSRTHLARRLSPLVTLCGRTLERRSRGAPGAITGARRGSGPRRGPADRAGSTDPVDGEIHPRAHPHHRGPGPSTPGERESAVRRNPTTRSPLRLSTQWSSGRERSVQFSDPRRREGDLQNRPGVILRWIRLRLRRTLRSVSRHSPDRQQTFRGNSVQCQASPISARDHRIWCCRARDCSRCWTRRPH